LILFFVPSFYLIIFFNSNKSGLFYFITTNLAGGFDTFADVDIVDVKVDGVMIEGCLGAVV
jgi:hypothetical protein